MVLRSIGTLLLKIPRSWACLPVLLWAGLIYFASSRVAPSLGTAFPFQGVIENFGHAMEYGVFAVWLALAAPRTADWVDLRPGVAAAILLVVLLYGASDEWHQSFVPGRDATAFDVLTDVAGAAATLSCIDAVGGGRSAGKRLGFRIAVGLSACLAAAILATYA